jgi:hypothetical protein
MKETVHKHDRVMQLKTTTRNVSISAIWTHCPQLQLTHVETISHKFWHHNTIMKSLVLYFTYATEILWHITNSTLIFKDQWILVTKSCSTTRHEGAWVEIRHSSYSFSTSALDGGEWWASRPGRALALRKGPPVPIVQEAGWASEPVWTQKLQEKLFCLCRGSNLDRPVVQSVANTHWATPAHILVTTNIYFGVLRRWELGSSVSIVSDYRLGEWGSIPSRSKEFLCLASVSRPALRPTQPPIQWVTGVISREGRGLTVTTHPPPI